MFRLRFEEPSAVHFARATCRRYRVTYGYSIVGVDRKPVLPYGSKVAVEVPACPATTAGWYGSRNRRSAKRYRNGEPHGADARAGRARRTATV